MRIVKVEEGLRKRKSVWELLKRVRVERSAGELRRAFKSRVEDLGAHES